MREILNKLKAETILEGTGVLEKIAKLRESFSYRTDDEIVSFEDYYKRLLKEADSIEQVQLQAMLAPGAGQNYLVDLTQAVQLVTDKIEQVHTRALFFSGKIRSAIQNRDNLESAFCVWYQIGASDILRTDLKELKLTATAIKQLSESEFHRVLDDEGTSSLASLEEAVSVLIEHLKHAKKLALEKYRIGTEQANSSMLRLPNNGFVDGGEPFSLLKQKYGLAEEVKEKPKYDDEEEEERKIEAPESPEYVVKREVPTDGHFPSDVVKEMMGVVQAAEAGVVSPEELESARLSWREKLTEKEESEPEPQSIIQHDPFLGEIKMVREEGEVRIKPVKHHGPSTPFDPQGDLTPQSVTVKPKPKYDDEEEFEEPPVATTPRKKQARKISFDDPF